MLNLLWLLDGEEHITVDLGVLEFSRKILGIGPVRKYNIDGIRFMSFNFPPEDPLEMMTRKERRLFKRGSIKFEYGKKIIRLAGELEHKETIQLMEAFRNNRNFSGKNFN